MFKNLIPWKKHGNKQQTGELTASKGDQWAEMISALDSVFDRFRSGDLSLPEEFERWNVGWGCDIKDSEDEIVVRADAPGFEPDEIDIKMSGNQLVLQAEHRETDTSGGHRTTYGKFYRSMTMPRGIEPDKITAEYKNGVLEVHLPKGEETRTRRIPVAAK